MKPIVFLLFLLICFNCKKNEEDASKITPTTKEQQTFDPNAEITMDDVIYAGVWRINSTINYADVQLNQSNDNVTGTIEYKVFDANGELQSSTGVLSLIGTVTDGILKADIYDPKGVKASTATIIVREKELYFKLTGPQINYPSSFTAYKI